MFSALLMPMGRIVTAPVASMGPMAGMAMSTPKKAALAGAKTSRHPPWVSRTAQIAATNTPSASTAMGQPAVAVSAVKRPAAR